MGESPGLCCVHDRRGVGALSGVTSPSARPAALHSPAENTHWALSWTPFIGLSPSRELAGGSLALIGAFESHRDLCPPHRPSQSTLGVPGAGLEAFHQQR